MGNESAPFSINYLPLLIRLECCETASMPSFLGSTLHGVLGWVLSSNASAYSYIFENRKFGGAKQDIVNPYIIEPPRPCSVYRQGDQLCFKFILIGQAIRYAQEVVESIISTEYFGLGVARNKFRLVDILQGERYLPIWRAGELDMGGAQLEILTNGTPEQRQWCSVHLLTPLRIRRGGELLKEIDFATIIRSITSRIAALTERYGGYVNIDAAAQACEYAKSVVKNSSGLYLSEMTRYSSRRDEKMDMSGLLGAMTFEGDLSVFTPWLNAARILHIGRNTTFGYGQVDVVFGNIDR